MAFADNLKEALSRLGITQSELARRTGINKAIISEYISGKYEPKQQNTYKIATALHLKPSELMGSYIEDSDNTPSYYHDPEVAEMANELKDNPDMRILFDASRKLSKKDIEAVIHIVKSMSGGE